MTDDLQTKTLDEAQTFIQSSVLLHKLKIQNIKLVLSTKIKTKYFSSNFIIVLSYPSELLMTKVIKIILSNIFCYYSIILTSPNIYTPIRLSRDGSKYLFIFRMNF